MSQGCGILKSLEYFWVIRDISLRVLALKDFFGLKDVGVKRLLDLNAASCNFNRA